VCCRRASSALKTEVARFSQTSANFYQVKRVYLMCCIVPIVCFGLCIKLRTNSGVPGVGVGGGWGSNPPPPPEILVLIKLSRIPSSVEYTSVTTWSAYGFHSFADWVEPLTKGLTPPDPRSLCPLSSTEFVDPPPPKRILGTPLLLTGMWHHDFVWFLKYTGVLSR
jgi:hypothetical protein